MTKTLDDLTREKVIDALGQAHLAIANLRAQLLLAEDTIRRLETERDQQRTTYPASVKHEKSA